MPWYEGLLPEHELELRERYPDRSLEQIALLALERHGTLLARFDPTVFRSPDELHMGFLYEGHEFPFVSVAPLKQAAFRDLVVAVMLRDEGSATAEPNQAAPGEPDLSGNPLPAVAVLRALRDYAADVSIQDVAKGDLSFRAARRVHTWVASGAAWWDPITRKVRTAPDYRLVGGGSPRPRRCNSFASDPA